jgi:hypothetical protein
LEEVRPFARERLAQTLSLEDIAVRARERLLELYGLASTIIVEPVSRVML